MNFDEADKTDWFPGTVVPEREGVYERQFPRAEFSKWNGWRWLHSDASVKEAGTYSDWESEYQNLPWRGLARDPNVVLREDLLALRELALDAAAEALAEVVTITPEVAVVKCDAPGLALDSGEFIPAAELNVLPGLGSEIPLPELDALRLKQIGAATAAALNAKAAVDDEEDLF